MTRINLSRNRATRKTPATLGSVARGKNNFENIGVLTFAGLLIVCSLAVGCSSEKPKQEGSNIPAPTNQATPITTPAPAITTAPAAQTSVKPAPKKIVRRAPVTVAYSDKASGVAFRYPRKYVLKTGDAADEVVSSTLVPMDFLQPGGVAIATVAIPEGAYPKSDLESALFEVSTNKSLTAEQCGEFATAQIGPTVPDSGATTQAAATGPTAAQPPAQPVAQPTKLILGDLELQSAEAEGTAENRKETSKYYHVFENGMCYEFALKVATTGVEPDEGGKPVDRDEVFKRLEKVLATVKISPVTMEKEAASMPVPAPASPAQ
jgi:hypothetical protein